MGVCTDHVTVITYGKVSDIAFWESWHTFIFRGIQHATSSTISISSRIRKIAKSDYLMRHVRPSVRVLVGKPEGKRPLGRPRRRWEDNIKMYLQEVGGSCGDWMEFAQDRDRWRELVVTVRNLRVPKMRGISWLAAEPVSFSRRTVLYGVSK